jgi:hypothetical protein
VFTSARIDVNIGIVIGYKAMWKDADQEQVEQIADREGWQLEEQSPGLPLVEARRQAIALPVQWLPGVDPAGEDDFHRANAYSLLDPAEQALFLSPNQVPPPAPYG